MGEAKLLWGGAAAVDESLTRVSWSRTPWVAKSGKWIRSSSQHIGHGLGKCLMVLRVARVLEFGRSGESRWTDARFTESAPRAEITGVCSFFFIGLKRGIIERPEEKVT